MIKVILAAVMVTTPVLAETGAIVPVALGKVTSDFGPRVNPVTGKQEVHSGIDLASPLGTTVRAIGAGVVIFSGNFGQYGNLVSILHGKGLTSHYGHLSTTLVQIGEILGAGTALGTVGATGRVTGAHLHFEIRKWGKALDPSMLLRAINAPFLVEKDVYE